MASVVSICNLSLSHLGEAATIVSIDPPSGTRHAETMALFFPVARDKLLERHNWSFAMKRVVLASVVVPATYSGSWAYAYSLPSDLVRPVAVLFENAPDDSDPQDYIIEDRTLYTNIQNATLRYVRTVTDPVKWSPLFINALSWELAADAAGTIQRGINPATKKALRDAAGVALLEAKNSDSKAVREPKTHVPEHIKARSGIRSLLGRKVWPNA